MIRGVLYSLGSKVFQSQNTALTQYNLRNQCFNFRVPPMASFTSLASKWMNLNSGFHNITNNSKVLLLKPDSLSKEQVRTVIKFSWKKGQRKSVAAVTNRFFRLRWGIWIRTIAGRHKKLWKRKGVHKKKFLQHVFCNARQSKMLDTMVSKYWRTPKYYINDPYEPYHKREEFSITRRKPWRPEGVDYE